MIFLWVRFSVFAAIEINFLRSYHITLPKTIELPKRINIFWHYEILIKSENFTNKRDSGIQGNFLLATAADAYDKEFRFVIKGQRNQ